MSDSLPVLGSHGFDLTLYVKGYEGVDDTLDRRNDLKECEYDLERLRQIRLLAA
jgi:hypothetical protein